MEAVAGAASSSVRLHIGGVVRREGWKVLNIEPGPCVDYVGDCADLSRFADGEFCEVYASHVIEHLGYQTDLPRALAGIHRILAPGGVVRMSVPNLTLLCKLFVHPDLGFEERFQVMRMMFGGQMDPSDFHRVGLSWDFARTYLGDAGFIDITRVAEFGLFEDTSSLRAFGHAVSLNVQARKRG